MDAIDETLTHLLKSCEHDIDVPKIVLTQGVHTVVPLLCLVAMAVWALVIITLVVFWRVGEVLLGKKQLNQFPSGTPHGPALYRRLERAHANVLENLPVFGAIVITGVLLGATSPLFSKICIVYIIARVFQSFFAIISSSLLIVYLRATFFLVQLLLCLSMVYIIVQHATHYA